MRHCEFLLLEGLQNCKRLLLKVRKKSVGSEAMFYQINQPTKEGEQLHFFRLSLNSCFVVKSSGL